MPTKPFEPLLYRELRIVEAKKNNRNRFTIITGGD